MRGKGVLLCVAVAAGCATVEPRGTGDLGIVVERAAGTLQLVDTTRRVAIGRVPRVAISG
jgi:protein NirF